MFPSQQVEHAAAQALFSARLMERVVHAPGPWTVSWNGVEVPAERTHTETGVEFSAEFPDLCYLHPSPGAMVLRCGGEVAAIRTPAPREHPGDTGFLLTWKVAVLAGVRVSQ